MAPCWYRLPGPFWRAMLLTTEYEISVKEGYEDFVVLFESLTYLIINQVLLEECCLTF